MKISSRLIVFLLLAIFLSSFVIAQTSGEAIKSYRDPSKKYTVFDSLKQIAIAVFKLDLRMSSEGNFTDATTTLVLRSLLFILLFAILYSILELVFKRTFPHGSKVTIAIVLALLSTIVTPDQFIFYIASTYGFTFFIAITAALIAGIVWLLFFVFEGATAPALFAKSTVCFVGFIILGMMSDLPFDKLFRRTGPGLADWSSTWTQSVIGGAEIMSAIFALMCVLYLGRAVKNTVWPAKNQPTPLSRLHELQAFANLGGSGAGELQNLNNQASTANTALNNAATVADLNNAVTLASNAANLAGRVMGALTNYASRATNPGQFANHLGNVNNSATQLRREINSIRVALAAGAPAGGGIPAAAQPHIVNAVNHLTAILNEAFQAAAFLHP